jgi:hypothetical protein
LQTQIALLNNAKPFVQNINTTIRCADFKEDFLRVGIKGGLSELLNELNRITKPCVYLFEINSPDISIIVNEYRAAKEKNILKLPPLNKNSFIANSKVLYVGKSIGGSIDMNGYSKLAGRINDHLGFYCEKQTDDTYLPKGFSSSLHLYQWAKDIDLELTLKIVTFDGNVNPILEGLENGIAKLLQPIFGRHS